MMLSLHWAASSSHHGGVWYSGLPEDSLTAQGTRITAPSSVTCPAVEHSYL